MLSSQGFDLWADDYDKTVDLSDEEDSYPFAGYKKILNAIYNRILEASCKEVLDVGFGTGTLISKLYERGISIYGQDFSERMIEIAQGKMPKAKLFKGDISNGLVAGLLDQKYDAIIATYSLHHLRDDEKIAFIKILLNQLKDGGTIYIGDVAFKTRKDHDMCMEKVGEAWDKDEFYFVVDELREDFPSLEFEVASECAGLISLKE